MDRTPASGKDYNCRNVTLRPVESVRYSWELPNGTTGRLPGVMQVRALSGQGEWMFVDTLHSGTSERGIMCTKHTAAKGVPVYHGEGPCLDEPVVVSVEDMVQPLPDRMADSGEQLVVRKRSRKNACSKVTVKALRAFLKKRSLPTGGTRSELLARARQAEGGEERPAGSGLDSEQADSDNNVGVADNGESDSETSSDEVHAIDSIESWQIVGKRNPQVQFYVRWRDDEPTWETEERLTVLWCLASPYDDKAYLKEALAEVQRGPKGRANTTRRRSRGK